MTDLSEQSGQALDSLMNCLSRENNLLDFLLQVCTEQMEALKSGDHKEVETAVGKAGHLINGLNTLEEERLRNKQILDAELGLDADSTFADLLPYISNDNWHEVNALRQNMQDKAERLRGINEINSIMTKQVLNFNEAMINVMNPKEDLTYGASGSRSGVARPGRTLLNKTV